MPVNALTIDVEDWYHPLNPDVSAWPDYEDRITESVRTILDVLARGKTTATFFILGDVAKRHPELVSEIARADHEIATHGLEHRFIYRQTEDEFAADVEESMKLLQAVTGEPVRGYRAPCFSITRQSLWALPILKKLGIHYDSSIFPVLNHRYGIPNAPRLAYQHDDGPYELPLSTYPLGRLNIPCGGGAYFRLYPYAVTRFMLRRLRARREPIVFYLHPWECDPGHPRIKVRATLRFRHYWALGRTAGKLASLIRDFEFASVREVLS